MQTMIRNIAMAFGLLFSPSLLADTEFMSSAHIEALHMVLASQKEELEKLDADKESQETLARSWAVFRPANAGELDRANTFTVTFSIDGRLLASWYVNIGEGTVEPNKTSAKPEIHE